MLHQQPVTVTLVVRLSRKNAKKNSVEYSRTVLESCIINSEERTGTCRLGLKWPWPRELEKDLLTEAKALR